MEDRGWGEEGKEEEVKEKGRGHRRHNKKSFSRLEFNLFLG